MPGLADDIVRLTPHLRRFARALVRGHGTQAADDIVQETIVLAGRADLPKRGPALSAWCFAALIRLNRLRHRQRGDLAGSPPAHDEPLPFLPKDIVRLDALSLELREVLLLAAMAGMNYQQVADILNIDLDLVFARLTRARDLLVKAAPGETGGVRAIAGERPRPAASIPHLRLVK